MGGESTIYSNLAAHMLLQALSHCAREEPSWYFSVPCRRCVAIYLLLCRVESDVRHPGATLIHSTIPLRNSV